MLKWTNKRAPGKGGIPSLLAIGHAPPALPGKGSAIRALVHQKITLPSGLFFQTVVPQLFSHRAGPTRACVFVL
jgi:hypothetical protein